MSALKRIPFRRLKHQETASETTNQALMATITELHAKYKGILGYRRMTRFVNRQLGTNYNKKRIRRLMHILGLSSVIRRSHAYCTKTSFVNVEANLLNREFIADAPNQKWCTDVTFLHYGLGSKAYLSAIKDLYDGSIVAYHISRHKDNPLVMENLRKAMTANPGARPLIHSDRGSQYTSKEYRLVTNQFQLTRSMSRVVGQTYEENDDFRKQFFREVLHFSDDLTVRHAAIVLCPICWLDYQLCYRFFLAFFEKL